MVTDRITESLNPGNVIYDESGKITGIRDEEGNIKEVKEGMTAKDVQELMLLGFAGVPGATIGRLPKPKTPGVLRKIENARIDRTIENLKARFPDATKKELAQLRQKLRMGEMNNYLKNTSGKEMKKTLKKYISGVMGVDVMMLWGTYDNVMGGRSIYYRDLAEKVKWGDLTAQEASEMTYKFEEFTDTAKTFINVSTMLNPLLIPFRRIINAGVAAQDESAQMHMNYIDDQLEIEKQGDLDGEESKRIESESKMEKQFATEDKLQKEKEFAETQKARDEDFTRRRKDSASIGTRGITQAPYEQKAREQPSKLGFGLL